MLVFILDQLLWADTLTVDLESTIVCDLEGYFSKDVYQYVVSEICFFNLSTHRWIHFLVETPDYLFNSRNLKQSKWCEKNLHRIPREFFNLSYKSFLEIAKFIPVLCRRIITKGENKSQFLRHLFQIDVIDMGDFADCPSYKVLSETNKGESIYCDFHRMSSNRHCALYKCGLIANYVSENK